MVIVNEKSQELDEILKLFPDCIFLNFYCDVHITIDPLKI